MARSRRAVVHKAIQVPPQHGAWAFLVVPLILGACLGAATWLGALFAVAWVAAYPTTYFLGRAVVARVRRGSWTTFARRELTAALPWAGVTAAAAIILLATRPWIIVPGAALIALWSVSVLLSWAGRERGIINDLLLVVLASTATPLMWAVSSDVTAITELPNALWLAALVCLVFFTGSVLHVKSLIREADDRRWHMANVVFHMVALIAMTWLSWWLAIPFLAALIRALVMRPGLRPGRIGAVEAVLCVLVIIGTVLAAG